MTPKEQDENHKYQSKIQAETKTNSNCHRNAKKRADRARTYKTLTELQIAKYSMILCKLGSISDLAGTMDYPTFANWLWKYI